MIKINPFNKAEKKGQLALLFLFLVTLLVMYFRPQIHEYLYPSSKNVEYSIEYIQDTLEVETEKSSIKIEELKPDNFNPNTVSKQALLQMGLSDKISSGIIKAREAGFVFYDKSDFLSLYVVDTSLFNALEKYINIPKKASSKSQSKESKANLKNQKVKVFKEKEIEIFEVNEADTTVWKSIPGIGSVYANRIVKFKDRLGGFYSLNQLYEVYGLDSNLIKDNMSYFLLDTAKINGLPINRLMTKELAKHPYINYKLANSIVNYRKQHGNYKSVKDLNNLVLMDSLTLKKIKPYIICND